MRWIGLLLCVAGTLSAWAQSATPSQQAERARQLVASGNAAQAIEIYEELLAASPENATLLVNLAVAQYEAGRFSDVITQSEKALALRPDLTTAWLFLGAAHFKLGEPASAVEPLEKVLEASPNERNANLMLAEALLQLERYDEAARRFLPASRLLADEVRVWYGLERACDAVSRQALQDLDTNAPDSAYRLLLRGDAALRLGRYAVAVHSYQQALDAQPEFGEALRSLARVYRKSGHAEWAGQVEQRLERLAAVDCPSAGLVCSFRAGRYEELLQPSSPGSPQPPASERGAAPEWLYWRAKACDKLAEEAFGRLAQLPESAQWLELQARRSDELGIYREAVKHWREALELAPKSAELRKGLALSLYRGGDFEQALPVLEELLGEQPDSAELHYLAGSSLLLSEEPRQGIGYLRKAIEKDPGFRRARGALGSALLQLGSFEEAIPHLQAALEIDEDGRLHYQLGRAYQGTGREQAAREALEDYQRIRQAAEERMRESEGVSEIAAP